MTSQEKKSGASKKNPPAGKNTSSARKSTSQKTSSPKTARRRPKAKKPKVKLSTGKVYVMTAAICFVCCLALFFSVRLNSKPVKQSQEIARNEMPSKPVERVQEVKPPVTKPVEIKQPEKKAENSVYQKKPESKTVSKPVTKPVESKKTETVAKVEAKNSSTVKNVRENVVKSQPDLSRKSVSSQKTDASKNELNKAVPKVSVPSTSSSASVAKNSSSAVNSVSPQKVSLNSNSTYVASAKGSAYGDVIQDQVKKSPFNIPPAQNGATIVIVIDDAGRSAANTRMYAQLPFPLTIAVLPKQPQTRQCAQAVVDGGKEMILHQPMQAENLNINPGPGAIRGDMTTFEIAATVKENLAELGPKCRGLNNHEGSLITASEIKIGAVLDVCAEKGVYFLDSRTTAATKAKQAALERDMFIFEKAGPYIDNEISREKMLERMLETLSYANRHGRAIVIGHVDKSVNILPDLLTEMYPYMKQAGYRFATPSMLK